jgi:hypothetical protein
MQNPNFDRILPMRRRVVQHQYDGKQAYYDCPSPLPGQDSFRGNTPVFHECFVFPFSLATVVKLDHVCARTGS